MMCRPGSLARVVVSTPMFSEPNSRATPTQGNVSMDNLVACVGLLKTRSGFYVALVAGPGGCGWVGAGTVRREGP